MARIPTNIADHVGGTPMVALTRVAELDVGVELYGKLEAYNPGGSVKDRIGVAMIEAAEREGRIEPGRTTIVEATSGNTGIALAFVCAAKGYDLVLTLPQGMGREREGLLRLYGADVRVTESLGGMNEAVDAARELARGADFFLPDQFSNPANPEIHRRTTAPEIIDALGGTFDVLVAGVGTGGTITGVGEVLKDRNPDARVVAVEPSASAVLSGRPPGPHKIQGIGAGFVPAVLNREVLDEVIPVDDDDAIDTARALARTEGVLGGISCGAALWAALQVARRAESSGKRIVVILPDSGERYVSTPFFARSPGTLSDAELDRYARQLVLPEFSQEAQLELRDARVLVVGVGALGSPAATYLVAAGAGRVGVVDDGEVELSNLHRQPLHATPDLGEHKAPAAAARLAAINPEVVVEPHLARLDAANAEGLVNGHDVVVDCTDRLETRYLVNAACCATGSSLVVGAVLGLQGTVLSVVPGRTACYRCVFPSMAALGTTPSCAEAGILGPVAGMVGALQALEAIKLITGIGEPLLDRMLEIDAAGHGFTLVRTSRRAGCPDCGGRPATL